MKRLIFKHIFLLILALTLVPVIAGCEEAPADSQCAHQLGELQREAAATFSCDGNIAYYRCAVCQRFFDSQKTEIASVRIPKLSDGLSICINGQAVPLILSEQNASQSLWYTEGLTVASGDVITVCSTSENHFLYSYSARDNIGPDGRVIDTASNTAATLTATEEGLTLSLSGLKYPGVVIQINGQQYPMNTVSCCEGNICAYTCGYTELQAGDRLLFIDNISGTAYGYEALSDDDGWVSYGFDFTSDGEIVIGTDARYAFTFNDHTDEKIHAAKTFAPFDAETLRLSFPNLDLESIPMAQSTVPADFALSSEILSYGCTDITDYIAKKGLSSHCAVLYLEAGTEFLIEDPSSGRTIPANHLTEASGPIEIQGDFISVRENGTYQIRYFPACDSIRIQQLSEGDVKAAAKAFDRRIVALPSNQELYLSDEIKALYEQYALFPKEFQSLIVTFQKLEAMYRATLDAEKTPAQITYHLSAANTGPVYRSKAELSDALFTDLYYYIAAYHGTANLHKYGVKSAEDLVALSKDPDGAGAADLSAIGTVAGRFFLLRDDNGILSNQSERSFAGFCYKNGLYQAQFPFFIHFFACWRLDEGFATSKNNAADFFSESWAPTVDIAKLFYYDKESASTCTDRVVDALTNVAGVASWQDRNDPLPHLTLRGYIFEGWYDNPDYSGEPVTGSDLTGEEIQLYAKWRIDQQQQDKDAAALVDVYIYNLTTRAATKNARTVGYVQQMYDALTENAQQLVTRADTLQQLIEQYLPQE